MRRLAVWPFAWGFGLAAGLGLGAALGAYGPTWGVAAAFPAVTLMFSFGSWREHDGEEMTQLLRLTLGFTLGFLAVSVPLTLLSLGHIAEGARGEATVIADVERMRGQLLARWLVIALALPGGLATLVLRRGRPRA